MVTAETLTFKMARRSREIIVVTGGAFMVLFLAMYYEHSATTAILAAAIFGAYLYSPQQIEVSDAAISIKSFLKTIHIPRAELRDVRWMGGEMTNERRTFGIVGLFANWGLFTLTALGKVAVHSTNSAFDVLIEADKTYIVSPENPDEFITALMQKQEMRA